MTKYRVHYNSSSRDTTDPTSYDITGLRNSETYNISVEAKSSHLSGESVPWTITLGKYFDNNIFCEHLLCSLTEPHIPVGVMVMLKNASVSVSWNAVNDADRYTVTFTRATGDEQEGACPDSTHTASVTVDAPSTTASIDIGENVAPDVDDMLRAYSTYFITVVAEDYVNGLNKESIRKNITTMQTSMFKRDVTSILRSYNSTFLYAGAAIPPANVRVTAVNSTAITVRWNIPSSICRATNGLITSYSIRYTIQPNGIPQTTLQSDGLEIALTELTPFTEYSIEVAAVNENGDVGVYSEPEVVMTPEARMLILYQSFIP